MAYIFISTNKLYVRINFIHKVIYEIVLYVGNLVHRPTLKYLYYIYYYYFIHSVFCKIHYLVYNDKMTRMNGDAVYELYAVDSSSPCESFLSTANIRAIKCLHQASLNASIHHIMSHAPRPLVRRNNLTTTPMPTSRGASREI